MFTHRNTRPLVAIEPPMESSTSRDRMYLKLNGQINRNASVRPFLTKALYNAMYSALSSDPIYVQSATDSLLSIVPAIGLQPAALPIAFCQLNLLSGEALQNALC